MGIEPHIWGPSAWATIHLICLGAPEVFKNEQLSYKKFFDALPYVLPCEKCKQHLIDHLSKTTMDGALAGGRKTLFAWSVQLHNAVNRSLGKPELSVEQALAIWSNYRPTNSTTTSSVSKPVEKNAVGEKILLAFMFIIVGMIIAILMVKVLRV